MAPSMKAIAGCLLSVLLTRALGFFSQQPSKLQVNYIKKRSGLSPSYRGPWIGATHNLIRLPVSLSASQTAQTFKRVNPKSDRFKVLGFDHIEFYCGDATNAYKRFQLGLGMNLVAKSDLSTGNTRCASYCLRSGEITFVFTAPFRYVPDEAAPGVLPHFDGHTAVDFFTKHGLAARAIGLKVSDAAVAHDQSVKNGGISVLAPVRLRDPEADGEVVISEVVAYGQVVLRFVSRHGYNGAFLPHYKDVAPTKPLDYGLWRLDHAVGNVWNMGETAQYITDMTGFHPFAEFTAEDVGTIDSGLNSIVLANNDEMVLMPVNEPTYGTRRKSQIATYLEHNDGAGLQHLALYTKDVFKTIRAMREVGPLGGFEFQEKPPQEYYNSLPERIGDSLTPEQYKLVDELGLLVDKDDQGVLLQVFTKPVGDRPTLFLEIIQRVGCMYKDEETGAQVQKGGCGGFGKGNFRALFKSIEDYEKTLKLN